MQDNCITCCEEAHLIPSFCRPNTADAGASGAPGSHTSMDVCRGAKAAMPSVAGSTGQLMKQSSSSNSCRRRLLSITVAARGYSLALHCLSKPSGVHMTLAMDSKCQSSWRVYICDVREPCLELPPKEAKPARLQTPLCMCFCYKGCAAPVGWEQMRKEHFSQGYLIHN